MSTSLPPYEIRGWDTGDDDFDMSIRRNGVGFTISVSPYSFINSPHTRQLFDLNFNKIRAGEDDEPEVWEYSEFIADNFILEVLTLAPPITHTGKLTLADLKARGSFTGEYRVADEQPVSGSLVPRVIEQMEPQKEWDMRLVQDLFPLFSAADVEVPYTDGCNIHNIHPRKVFVNGKPFFYKSCWSPYDAVDEVQKYCRIAASGLSILELRTSRLFGIVADSYGQTKGLLYHWIHMYDIGTLASFIDQNAVLIDFEGGTTRGWVDHEKGGSVDGDLQGLERIADFILTGDSHPLGQESDVEYGEFD
ncbi:hypothetical protein VHEMI05110 [[Torrubiella] hemipterigena]|uniref:Uncharacterized protein n=1 Tax=[Torrubiella] hemipterigena TaxID=1531966 RepID=A0A0A1SX48_9HYPO|nr:hypothetical protein VHEMI05110 [[Torrubiella] hemipterigena]